MEATFKNALNALGAPLAVTYHYYSFALAAPGAGRLAAKDTTRALQPESMLLRLPEDHYYSNLIV